MICSMPKPSNAGRIGRQRGLFVEQYTRNDGSTGYVYMGPEEVVMAFVVIVIFAVLVLVGATLARLLRL